MMKDNPSTAGRLINWNAERGFGFLHPKFGKNAFVHFSVFERAGITPLPDRVYEYRCGDIDGKVVWLKQV